MGAMPEEINGIVDLLSGKTETTRGGRTYYTGTINDVKTVVVFSRWGKVAAATTAANLILEFKITDLIFTGVAGGIDPELGIGDIVVASKLIQHDLDARPIIPQFEIPLLKKTYLESSVSLTEVALTAVNKLIEEKRLHQLISAEDLQRFGISRPKVVKGVIASGDKFFASTKDKHQLIEMLPDVHCVEMEGAATAQTCFEYNIPFTVVRTISDTADDKSPEDFPLFIRSISSKYAAEIIRNICSHLSAS